MNNLDKISEDQVNLPSNHVETAGETNQIYYHGNGRISEQMVINLIKRHQFELLLLIVFRYYHPLVLIRRIFFAIHLQLE